MKAVKERFRAWWKREREADFCYEDAFVTGMARDAAEFAYLAGWRAAKRDSAKSVSS
jgi:hypothetical protein